MSYLNEDRDFFAASFSREFDGMAFEHEELSSDDTDTEVEGHRHIGGMFFSIFKRENDSLGDDCFALLADAESQPEGYYLRTCSKLKTVHQSRMKMFEAFNETVALHNRIVNALSSKIEFLRSSTSSRTDTDTREFLESISALRFQIARCQSQIKELNAQCEIAQSDATSAKNRLRCMEESSRMKSKTIAELTERIEGYKNLLKTEGEKRFKLQEELVEARKRSRNAKGVVAFLNKRIRAVIKCVRKGSKNQSDEGGEIVSNCHVLGTYDDIIGSPV